MTTKEINSIYAHISNLIKERRLRDVFVLLANYTKGAMFFELTDKVEKLEQTYAYMLSYLTAGADDPHRDRMLNDLIAQIYVILDNYVALQKEKEIPTLYYNVRRFRQRQQGAESLDMLIKKWKDARSQALSMSSLFADASQKDSGSQTLFDSAETSLFNGIWTSFPLSKTDRKGIVDIISDPLTSTRSAVRFVSALGLAALEFADNEAIYALCDIYTANADKDDNQSKTLTAIALVFLIIALNKYSDRQFETTVRLRLEALSDVKSWHSDVRTVFMEMVRSRDTERITRTMREEIIPGMMALRPEIEKKIRDRNNNGDFDDMIEDNPEWEELLNNSKIVDKLKELNELQMEGSDVFMSTFAHLKSFPFFNEIVNWFTPFDTENKQVEDITIAHPELAGVISVIKEIPFLCDSDKYSMLHSLDLVPKEQIQMMLSQMTGQQENIEDLKNHFGGLTKADNRKADIRNFIQNLYRFVNLFRRKSEFYNAFKTEFNPLANPLLKDALHHEEFLKIVGEFYFRHGYYTESLSSFSILDDMGEVDSTLYQKMGYAYEKTNDLESAARFYEQAELLDGSSKWTKMRLSSVYRRLNRLTEAAGMLSQLREMSPEETDIALLSGYIYIEMDNYREALKHFYKAEFLSPDDRNVQKSVAWSLFMIHDFEKSQKYYDKLLMNHPSGEDYLNMGHVALAQSQFKEAINFYKLFILSDGNDKEAFFKALDADREHMIRVGIKPEVISLIADAMLYELEEHK